MQYDFNSCPSRYGTNSTKWDGMAGGFGAECKYPLWIADMDFVSPPEVVKALQERVAHGVFGYSITPDSYLEAIVEWEKTRHNFAIEKDWILFSPGVVPGVYWSVNLFTQPGDKVMVLTPVYNPFFAAIKNQGRTLVECPLQRDERGHYGVDLDLFARTIRENDVKVFILCSPHNPVGRVWTRAEIDSMVDICVENGVLIVSDEIHQDIVFEGYEHLPTASTSQKALENTITITAATKTFNLAGLQNSILIVPDKVRREKIQKYASEQLDIMGGNLLGYVAVEAAYRHGGQWLDELIAVIEQNYRLLCDYIAKMPKLNVTPMEATYLAWVDMNGLGLDDDELDAFLKKECLIAANMGRVYGPNGKGFVRFNIGCQRDMLTEALESLLAAYNKRFA